jgi:hypothetical protein
VLVSSVLPLVLLAFQAPGDGWALTQAAPREVRRLYWDLFQLTEVWLRLTPEGPNGEAPLVNLVFQAFFPGRAERDPYSGGPRAPKGPPARLVVRAEPLPSTIVRALSLQLVVDGTAIDLTPPGGRYRNLPCLVASEECVPNAVEAEIDESLLRSLVAARAVDGAALGLPIRLSRADQDALGEFLTRVGLGGESMPR